jgi:hypothetical protein
MNEVQGQRESNNKAAVRIYIQRQVVGGLVMIAPREIEE